MKLLELAAADGRADAGPHLFGAIRRLCQALDADRGESAVVSLEALPNVPCGAVIDAMLPVLLTARKRVQLDIAGVTHGRSTPAFPFYRHALQPALRRLGFDVGFDLGRPGFEGSPPGVMSVHVRPVPTERLRPISWGHAGFLTSVRCEILIASNVPYDVAQRHMHALRDRLRSARWPLPAVTVREAEHTPGKGTATTVRAICTDGEAVFTVVADAGDDPRQAAERAADPATGWLKSSVAAQRRLSRRLVVPMALARGGRFVTSARDDPKLSSIAEMVSVAAGVDCRFIRHGERLVVEVADPLPITP